MAEKEPNITDLEGVRHATMIAALDEAESVENLNNELFQLTSTRTRLAEAIAGREAEIYSKVSTELDDKDKPKYGNDGARKAEAFNRTSKDAILVKMREEITTNDVEIARKRERINCITTHINIRRAFLHGS